MVFSPHQIYSSEQIKESEMHVACMGVREVLTEFWWRTRREDCIGELTHEWKADKEI